MNSPRFEKKLIAVTAIMSVLLLTGAAVHVVRSPRYNSPISLFLTPDQRGQRLFQLERYDEAADEYVNPRWQATALYRDAQFKRAAGIYAGMETAEGVFNHANALVMQGKYEDAVRTYDRALATRPDWEDAKINRRIAVGRAERTRKEGGDMTGGKMGADEITFEKGQNQNSRETETVEAPQQMSDAELRAAWLRRVQTSPADFLRAKFAYQYSSKEPVQE